MKIWVLSDLHLETVPHPDAFKPKPKTFDVLVSAGDIVQGKIEDGFKVLRHLAGTKPVIAVLGNHEFWNGAYAKRRELAPALAAKHKITLLDGDATTRDGVHFVGATLWTDFKLGFSPPDSTHTGEMIAMPDGQKYRPLTIGDSKAHHKADLEKLSMLLSVSPPRLPVVVLTHHAPHPATLKPPGAAHPNAGVAASDLSHLTDAGRAKLWIHGHLHHSVDLIRPNGTRLLCNPAGYRFENALSDETKLREL